MVLRRKKGWLWWLKRPQSNRKSYSCGHKPMSLQKQPWSDVEKGKLAKGIKQRYQETLILDSTNNGSSTGDFSAVYALANTGNFEVAPESLKSILPLINWDNFCYVSAWSI